nr:putative disease resistance protein [Quercus suber]
MSSWVLSFYKTDLALTAQNNTGTKVVEGIMLNMPIQEVEHLSAEVFSKMKILRLLIIGNMKLPKDFINGTVQLPKVLIRGNVQLPKVLSYLFDELRIIEWNGYPLKSMPTSFQTNKLVEIKMHCSRIIQLWKGIMLLDALKLMDLSDS